MRHRPDLHPAALAQAAQLAATSRAHIIYYIDAHIPRFIPRLRKGILRNAHDSKDTMSFRFLTPFPLLPTFSAAAHLFRCPNN
jgi:hypothetical protein